MFHSNAEQPDLAQIDELILKPQTVPNHKDLKGLKNKLPNDLPLDNPQNEDITEPREEMFIWSEMPSDSF